MPVVIRRPRHCVLVLCALIALASACATPRPLQAQTGSIEGELTYTGQLGPINRSRPLCLCIYREPTLAEDPSCYILSSASLNPYRIPTSGPGDYYLIAFVDIHLNERVDPDEPYEIFHDRAEAPGDPVQGGIIATGVDLVFGDENLPSLATTTPTVTQAPSPTPTRPPCVGDCDASGDVGMGDLVTLGARIMDTADAGSCNPQGAGEATVETLVTAVNNTANCPL